MFDRRCLHRQSTSQVCNTTVGSCNFGVSGCHSIDHTAGRKNRSEQLPSFSHVINSYNGCNSEKVTCAEVAFSFRAFHADEHSPAGRTSTLTRTMLELPHETDDTELIEKRLELRQKLKSKLLTLSPSRPACHSFSNFIPNARDPEFLVKQGLDCVMNYLVTDSADCNEHLPCTCSVCRMDSTQNWWCSLTDETFLCDQCEQNRVRQTIIQQHRDSMKSAFLQAKESERRLEVDHQRQRKGAHRTRRLTTSTGKTPV